MPSKAAQRIIPASSDAEVVPFCPPLITPTEREQLVANGYASISSPDGFDPSPVVRLVSPMLQVVWLLSEMDPCGSGDIAFGLVDQGGGCADLACIDLEELAHDGLFRRDPRFRASGPLSRYLALARRPTHACSLAEDAAALA